MYQQYVMPAGESHQRGEHLFRRELSRRHVRVIHEHEFYPLKIHGIFKRSEVGKPMLLFSEFVADAIRPRDGGGAIEFIARSRGSGRGFTVDDLVCDEAQELTDEQLDEFVRNHAETAFHPCGTCKMGYDEMAVVDGEGRVHGLEGLRVVDASIMPQIITGNLNATTIMIGEKIADAIRGREPLAKSTAAYYVANGAPVRR